MANRDDAIEFLPSRFSPRVTKGFSIVTRRMFRKQFAAIRMVKGSRELIESLDRRLGPAIIAVNHSSWWDPLVCVLLASTLTTSRTHAAPMDIEQLRRFRFMRKLGIFGVSPDDPRSLPRMTRHVLQRFSTEDRCTLWITPQGEFRDVRDEIALRPGVGAIAARASAEREIPVLSLAIEYGFWEDKRPEAFLRVQRVRAPDLGDDARRTRLVEAWTEAITEAMRENQCRLAQIVMERDARPFDILIGGHSGTHHPLYDLWLRLRRKQGPVVARRSRREHELDGPGLHRPTTTPGDAL